MHRKKIPEDQAVEKLIELIKANGDYTRKIKTSKSWIINRF